MDEFIFAYVPKVACTSWKSLLRRQLGYSDWPDGALAHDRQASGLTFVNTRKEFEFFNSDFRPKLAMTRNPYTRIFAAYRDKIEKRVPFIYSASHDDHFIKKLV